MTVIHSVQLGGGRQRVLLQLAITAVLVFLLYRFSPWSLPPKPAVYSRPPRPSTAFQWDELAQHYPVESFRPLPSGKPEKIPRIQHKFGREYPAAKAERKRRLHAVKVSFDHAWEGYVRHAWFEDEVRPLSGEAHSFLGDWGGTAVDALDTLWIMGNHSEFERVVKAIEEKDFTNPSKDVVMVFETTIRIMGGFLGAYDLSGGKYPILLAKAQDMGEMLYGAFDTPNRMPASWWKWRDAVDGISQTASNGAPLADLGSLSLEFTRLSQLTGDPRYFDAIARITDVLEKAQDTTRIPGMWPGTIDAAGLTFNNDHFSLGALSDSAYEYLPKQYMMLGARPEALAYRKMYEKAFAVFSQHLFFRPMIPNNTDILFTGNAKPDDDGHISTEASMQHLACFAGGMVSLAAKIFDRPSDLATGRRLVDGCVWAYNAMPSGIMPEAFFAVRCPDPNHCTWDQAAWDAIDVRPGSPPGMNVWDSRYLLRPETIESIFIQYRITGDASYQDRAWELFETIERQTRTAIAHAAVENLTQTTPDKVDSMESFWLAETLKYFYLIFEDPGVVSLDEYVFNTEAHPLKRER